MNRNALRELTWQTILLGILLSVMLAAANAYLGLFAGMTVSASIPAAVMAMAIFRMMRRRSVLEANAVQTAASAGESLVAGAIFTLPALVMMGFWEQFNYWESTLILWVGGVLGVLFTVPLRKALIVFQQLRFPEGIATAEVLRAGVAKGQRVKYLVQAAMVGAIFKLMGGGLRLWDEIVEQAMVIREKWILYGGMNVSPALLAVGYIVGFNIAILIFLGGMFSWWVAMPFYVYWKDMTVLDGIDQAYVVWSTQIRYLGVGAMIVGGLWTVFQLIPALRYAITVGINSFRDKTNIQQSDQDLPLPLIVGGVMALFIPVVLVYRYHLGVMELALGLAVFALVAGFLFSTVAGYMAGLVGSSNNPISGVTIATILSVALLLVVFLGTGNSVGPAMAILVGTVVCAAAAIAGDNMQDLKTGFVVGATPWKQQIMQLVGVTAAAFFIAPILNILNTSYGFGARTPDHPFALPAPQATLMQSVAEGVFGHHLPWGMIIVGAGVGGGIILLDQWLQRRKSSFRLPVLAVAVGLYLPLELDIAIFIGGLLAWLVKHRCGRSEGVGVLAASGIITGEALMGIALAVPIMITGNSEVWAVGVHWPHWVPLVAFMGVLYWLYRVAISETRHHGQTS